MAYHAQNSTSFTCRDRFRFLSEKHFNELPAATPADKAHLSFISTLDLSRTYFKTIHCCLPTNQLSVGFRLWVICDSGFRLNFRNLFVGNFFLDLVCDSCWLKVDNGNLQIQK